MTDAAKLKQLEDWLINNPEHPDRLPVWQNKIALENLLKFPKMTKTELQQRFELLGNVLYHSRDRGYFSSGQRTCLNMERSAIIRAINHIELDGKETAKPSYTIPEHLEVKCKQVITDFKI